jgi:hypothetical protein
MDNASNFFYFYFIFTLFTLFGTAVVKGCKRGIAIALG